MHIAEGILSAPVLAGGAVAAGAGVYAGLRALDDEAIPKTALLTAAFFVAGLVHVPLGVGSVHLVLNGLLGMILGWTAFPAILVALTLQTVLLRYGGLTTLGVNTVVMAVPAVVSYYLFVPFLRRRPRPALVFAFGCAAGAAGIAFGALLASGALALSGRAFYGVAALFFAAHAPLMVVEGIITGGLLLYVWRLKPELFLERERSP